MAENEKKDGRLKKFSAGASRWWREMRSELKKVVWPTPKQVLNNSWVVIVLSVSVGIAIGVFDWLASLGVKELILAFK